MLAESSIHILEELATQHEWHHDWEYREDAHWSFQMDVPIDGTFMKIFLEWDAEEKQVIAVSSFDIDVPNRTECIKVRQLVVHINAQSGDHIFYTDPGGNPYAYIRIDCPVTAHQVKMLQYGIFERSAYFYKMWQWMQEENLRPEHIVENYAWLFREHHGTA